MPDKKREDAGLPPGNLSTWMEKLSPKRRDLIQTLLQDPRTYVLLSVRAVAARLDTDPATIVRVVQRMGFANYRAFQNYLHDLSISNATSFDGMQAASESSAHSGDFEHHMQATLQQDVRNLNALRASLDMNRLKALARRMHTAKRCLILGGDLAENLVHYLAYHLSIIGLPVHTATTVGRSIHITRSFGKNDLVLAISFRRGLRHTVDGMKRARSNGAYCVGITGTYISPIARYADEFFIAPIESQSFIDSYVAPIALANQILVAAANYKREISLELLREASEEQRRGYRWYEAD
ncbi:MAG: MurR/RpiR family transcriptional regulator [Edaphobacter sp.]|uniref:MurR/RpiR family transcriptional regulator n=1 Tax=Edaphobacter sp. TaxID=1934404 RepID=UPI0023A64C9E|nr:MurR/RpiR family transcriptional regulator [Edaphobacter sp.]MDE1175835.1 MurR/RpiR family transcriptional regulator [Edaphobacter sp.]